MMKKKFLETNSIRIAKLIVELRVEPRLDYYDRLFKVSQNFVNRYPQWVTSWQEVTLNNVELRRNLILRQHVWSQMFEHPNDDDWMQDALEIFPKVSGDFGYSSATRFGFRVQTYRPLGVTFEEAVKLFNLLNHSQELRGLPFLNEQVSDDSFILNTEHDGWKYHFEVGPVRSEEVIGRSNFTFEESRKQIPTSSAYLWVDVDVAAAVVDIEKFQEVLLSAQERAAERIEGIHSFFEG